MLKVRVIPTLLWKDFGLVKGIGFDSWRRVGAVMPSIKVYNRREVDELVLVDITATPQNGEIDLEQLRDFADECFVPLTVGGGVRNAEDARRLLRAGADKVAINTGAFLQPSLATAIAAEFGVQCVVASIDARAMEVGHEVFVRCGKEATGRAPEQWAREMEDRGAGEILLTSIDRDGTMQGYDLALIEKVTRAVKVPVVASGGAGKYEHMRQAIQEAGASAVAAASIFHFTEQTPREAKLALAAAGIPVRLGFEA
jgi:imidazole glycerol-phosphate synthase subunit HisF